MRWNCDARAERRFIHFSSWHRWFAWWPVRIARGDCRWLEWIERKGNYWAGEGYSGYNWEYRTPPASSQPLKKGERG